MFKIDQICITASHKEYLLMEKGMSISILLCKVPYNQGQLCRTYETVMVKYLDDQSNDKKQ